MSAWLWLDCILQAQANTVRVNPAPALEWLCKDFLELSEALIKDLISSHCICAQHSNDT